MKEYKQKRCPRCKGKMHIDMQVCPYCNLSFDRIQHLSNKQAKIEIKNKNYNHVLYTAKRPEDVSLKKFLILFFTLGFWGAHNMYIGKFKRAYYALITGIISVIGFIIDNALIMNGVSVVAYEYYFLSPIFMFWVFAIIMWFYDLFAIILKKYKYPATLSENDLNKVVQEKTRG